MALFLKQLPALAISTAILAAIIVLGYFGHIAPTDAAGMITALATALGLTGIIVLAIQTIPNATLVSHVVFTVEIIAGVTVLTLHNVFTSAETVPLLYLFISGGTVAVGVGAVTTFATRLQPAVPKPVAPQQPPAAVAPPIQG